MRLGRKFFERNTIAVAKDLLGKVLVRKFKNQRIRTRILETEAYIGGEDQACHARHGRTARNAVMYGEAGRAYIYLCYGIHELLNVVTEAKGRPAAVLVRKVQPLLKSRTRVEPLQTLGPGNLTKYLKITRKLNGEDLAKSKKLWLEDDGFAIKRSKIKSAERIGVDYAGKWAKRKWRFYIQT